MSILFLILSMIKIDLQTIFFEYEQGQKDIIVKHKLRDHIDFWESINPNDFMIDTIF